MTDILRIKQLNSVLREIDEMYHLVALKLGMSDSAMWILYSVCAEENGIPLCEVVNYTNICKQTINSSLRKLEAEGIVYLVTEDNRRKRVMLTQKGKALANDTVLRLYEAESRILDTWTKEECDMYYSLTKRYLKELCVELNNL